MNNLVPILLFTYNRVDHLNATIDSLLKNNLAAESDLIIFSDGPKDNTEKNNVARVREQLTKVSGFKSIKIIEREINFGLADSIITGIEETFKEYEKVIVLEDDLVFSNNFLQFMNDALNFYSDHKNIFSISGYSHPLEIPSSYKDDVFILPRASSWGWATWKDRWEKADWAVKDFPEFRKDKILQKAFNRGGEDLTPMLKAQMFGYIDSWAIRWVYAHFKNTAYSIYPVKSKVNHIGDDFSGTHTHKNIFFSELDNSQSVTKFISNPMPDNNILMSLNNLVKPSLIRKTINYFKYEIMNK